MITDFYYADQPVKAEEKRHQHNVYQMLYVTKGEISCEIAGKSIIASAPSLVFIGNYEPHIVSVLSESYERYVLTLNPYLTSEKLQPRSLQTVFSFHPEGFVHALDVSPIADEIRMLIDMLYREWRLPENERLDGGADILLSALLCRVFRFSPRHFVSANFGRSEMTVAAVRRVLECDFYEKLNLDALAEQHHVSRYHLAHMFKRITGYSLKEYRMLCRISFACQQLQGDRTVGEIAEMAGFRDMSNFSRSFKEIVGMTPTEFRQKQGREDRAK